MIPNVIVTIVISCGRFDHFRYQLNSSHSYIEMRYNIVIVLYHLMHECLLNIKRLCFFYILTSCYSFFLARGQVSGKMS